MPLPRRPIVHVDKRSARRLWLHAQPLDERMPFGEGPGATAAAVEHLGYVQIDTINVIERAHHHILWTRIPTYRREDLHRAQTLEKTVFEYWTHALSYVPTRDYRFFLPEMRRRRIATGGWFGQVNYAGALTAFRHAEDLRAERASFWPGDTPGAGVRETAIRVSAGPSAPRTSDGEPRFLCHLDAKRKAAIREIIERRLRRRQLVAVALEGAERIEHCAAWALSNSQPNINSARFRSGAPSRRP